MVIHDSACIPILRTVDAVYEMSVSFYPLVEPKHDIGNALLLYMHAAVESSDTFMIRSINMYKATRPKDQDHIAVLSFSTRDPVDYIKLVSQATTWFNGMKQIAVGINDTVNISMAIVDSYYNKLSFHGGASRKTFEPSFEQTLKSYNESRTIFKICKCRFCYQIEAIPSEVELLGALIRVKRTNAYLPKQSLSRMLVNRTRYALCSEYLLGQQNSMDESDDKSAVQIRPSEDMDEDESVKSDERFAIAMPAFIGFIVLVSCLFHAVRKRQTLSEDPVGKRRTLSEESVGNQIELQSIPS